MKQKNGKNRSLGKARKAKNDEFYTQLKDIDKEMCHYDGLFEGKVVYCNCDNPRMSNFHKYFSDNFGRLGLMKLITTGYNSGGCGFVRIIDGDGSGGLCGLHAGELVGNGDFRSDECVEFLKEADIVVTNPPFSLFREYIAQLMEYNKKFIIVGNSNAITYKEVFPLIRNDRVWLGASKGCGGKFTFAVGDDYDGRYVSVVDGVRVAQVNNACWFTNLPHDKRERPLVLHKVYSPDEYSKYDNYDAIDSTTADIPVGYDGVIGVPISFLDKYNPKQFEIIWTSDRGGDGMLEDLKVAGQSRYDAPTIGGVGKYKRIFIRHRK